MRCDNCKYCQYDRADDMYLCYLGIEETENAKGQCGCRFNKKTLDKVNKEYWEEEAKTFLDMNKKFEVENEE